ncbi:G-protein subunit alpha 10 [Dictyostelium discoideum AX4]|uniref:Guanine nucleotide-binding protein-like alpha-10 subunit n=1 Tax=Dictyostelium discoideum TaxID=44689 RepID=GPA10_DICDI|nr:G-protein subunit alpha 10 [Dictyostelium discoideum AX4]Q55EP5.1 RecName: Full=Guanine nucleotide-binding protein-like alpha-10 subunit [Dictyostelium discoideum]EAL72990.1 G-protein subunit alpha 10 [Dictyostelium discoideum AX4]|eukprot:XP_646975.1 G-protein subunit alpha 10 [Dictyostelium discoideum AX4]
MSFLCSENSYQQQSKISIDIDKSLKNHKLKLEEEIRVLIYGQKKVGVTTLFKTFLLMGESQITPEELMDNRNNVYKTIINQLKKFIIISNNSKIELENNNNIQMSNLILELDSENFLWNKEIGETCLKLWNDSGIQKIFQSQFSEFFGYFFKHLQRISDENYTPTPQDLNFIKLTQNGIIEGKFTFERCLIKMIEMGIQTSTLKKWINCFSEVQAIIYVIDLSVYDIVESEDCSKSINKLEKSLNGFKEIIESKYLHGCGVIVFFNKKDIFREKLKTVPFKTYDKDYIGENDFESTTNFIKNKLLDYYSNPNKNVYFLINEESEVDICRSTFNILKDIVLNITYNSVKN